MYTKPTWRSATNYKTKKALKAFVEAPADSNGDPVAILVQDDLELSYCDQCLLPAKEWDRDRYYHPLSRPGAMFNAALYCATCMPYSYDPDTGRLVNTFWL